MRSWCPALLLCLLPCSPLPGQSASDRPALDRFQDSLAAAADTLGLAAVMHGLTRKDPADPLRALRAGLVAARLAELGVDPDADRARDQLRKVTRRQPGWPCACMTCPRGPRRFTGTPAPMEFTWSFPKVAA